MTNIQEDLTASNDIDSSFDEYMEKRELVKEIDELKKIISFHNEEKIRLNRDNTILSGELEGLKISISSSKAYIKTYEERKKKSHSNIQALKNKKLQIVNDINELHFKIKDLKMDEQSSIKLKDSLNIELNEIANEKSIVMKRLDVVRSGIDELSSDKEKRLPGLASCDAVLKQVYGLLRESQDRMEVSSLLKK